MAMTFLSLKLDAHRRMGMSPFAFLTLLASVHIVAGTMSPKSCPAGNKPAEMIAREIKSDEARRDSAAVFRTF